MYYDPFPENEHTKNLRTVRDFQSLNSMLDDARRKIKELDEKMSILPKVEEDGSSECPFAKDLYAEKEAAEKKLSDQLSVLRHRASILESELERCRQNMDTIVSDGASLQTIPTQNQYQQAETIQAQEWRKIDDLHQQFLHMIQEVEKWLEKSQQKKFPIKSDDFLEPSHPTHFPNQDASPNGDSLSQRSDNVSPELDDLFSIGPIKEL